MTLTLNFRKGHAHPTTVRQMLLAPATASVNTSMTTTDAVKILIDAFIANRVNYCNSVFASVCAVHLQPLQSALKCCRTTDCA